MQHYSEYHKLLATQAHIWFCHPSEFDNSYELDLAKNWLSKEELKKYQKIFYKEDRIQYLVSHVMLRRVLSEYIDLHPKLWQYDSNSYGKPFISYKHKIINLQFNLSHTRRLIALIITQKENCGIDIELIRPLNDYFNIARLVFSQNERITMSKINNNDVLKNYFFSLWTLKEAYIKARGIGLSLDLKKISFSFGKNKSINLFIESELHDHSDSWQIDLFPVNPDHMCGVCLHTMEKDKLKIIKNSFNKTYLTL